MSSLHQKQKTGVKVTQGFCLKIGALIQETHSLLLLSQFASITQMPTSARPLPASCLLTPQPA